MRIVSFHNGNIDQIIIEYQKKVFNHFGCDIEQVLTDLSHPEAIDNWLKNNKWDKVAIFDIDCIPLSDLSLNEADNYASEGYLYGAAQHANHIPESDIYVSPAFICFSKETYNKLGKPSFMPTKCGDVGSELTYKAKEKDIPVKFINPTDVKVKKWKLNESTWFGLGTNYEDKVFHAFESRMNNSTSIFIDKCNEVLGFHSWNSEPQVGNLLAALIDIHECKEVLEVGVFKGYTSKTLIERGVNYTGIDIEDHRSDSAKELMVNHNFIIGDSLNELKKLPSKKYDLIFIDSVHEYDHCMKEFKLCERLIKKGGLICFHDSIKFEGVKKVIDYIKTFKHFDVLTLNTPDIEGRGGRSGLTIVKCNYV